MKTGTTLARMTRTACLVLGLLASTGPAVADDAQPGLQLTAAEQEFIKSHPVLTLCADPDWMPYEGLSPDGKHIGLIAAYALEFQTRTGLQFKVVPTKSWEESWRLVKAGKCDIVAGLNRTADRELYLSFTEAYIIEPKVLVIQAGRNDITGLEDLQGKRLAVVQGYSLDENLALDYPTINRVYVNSLQDALPMLAAGEIDAVAGAEFLMEAMLEERGYDNLEIVTDTHYLNMVHVGIQREYFRGYTIMNKAVKSLTYADHKAMLARYLASMTASR